MPTTATMAVKDKFKLKRNCRRALSSLNNKLEAVLVTASTSSKISFATWRRMMVTTPSIRGGCKATDRMEE